MKIRWISFKCPTCRSIVHMKAGLIKSRLFLCPVCEEGEIEYCLEPPGFFHDDTRLPPKRRELLNIRSGR